MDPGLLEKLLGDLVRAEVRFLVVGGVACVLNGYVRTTEDLDLLVDPPRDNVQRLLDVLERFGAGHARELRVEDFTDEEGAIRLIEDFPVDLFTRMGGRRYDDLLPHRLVAEGEPGVPYVDAAGLILLKASSVRTQDRVDVEALQAIVRRRPSGG